MSKRKEGIDALAELTGDDPETIEAALKQVRATTALVLEGALTTLESFSERFAKTLYQSYRHYTKAGFSAEQAFVLVQGMMSNLGQTKKHGD